MRMLWHLDPIAGDRVLAPSWPEGWPVPRVGDNVVLPSGDSLKVTAVDWCPEGDGDITEPFVYVVTHNA